MKKRLVVLLLTMMMATCTVACGKGNETSGEVIQESSVEKTAEVVKEEKKEKKKEEKNEELPNWIGRSDYFGYFVATPDEGIIGDVKFTITFPSLRPTSVGAWAYQNDPALVLVTSPGLTSDLYTIMIDSLEETFETSEEHIISALGRFRGYKYSDFDFVIETQELMTINDLSVCKYTGTHTYILEEEAQEIPFVAYSVDTKQVANSYPTIIVMDDSINNPSMEPLPEGIIETYAKKMVESIVLKQK